VWPVSVLVVANRLRSAVAMGTKLIVPASPPFPTPSKRPFQSIAGIQTSKWITEASVGFRIPCTAQNAGKFSIARPFGGVKVPAGTCLAEEIVVFGRSSLAKPSHVAAWAARLPKIVKVRSPLVMRCS
jgi:hypothetical protein